VGNSGKEKGSEVTYMAAKKAPAKKAPAKKAPAKKKK
jgi:hypothetical protein